MMHPASQSETLHRVASWLQDYPLHAPAVVIPVFNAFDDVMECLDSMLTEPPSDCPILVFDDASTDERVSGTLESLSKSRPFAYVRKPANGGFVETVNLAFKWCAPRDVVVVNSDVVLPPGWLERLRAAAYARSNIATATPFTNNGTLLSIPDRNRPSATMPAGMTVAQVDARIRDSSLLLRPIIPTAVGHCVFFKRTALDAVGYFDESLSPGYGEEVDFSQRAVTAGFVHVLADDLFVFHKGSRSFGVNRNSKLLIQESHERIIARRYPWYHAWKDDAEHDPKSPLAFAIERARAALQGYRIAIDASRVDGTTTGTQVLTLELIRALAPYRSELGHLAVIIGDTVSVESLRGVDRLVDQVVRVSDLKRLDHPLFDLIHRPFQNTVARDLDLLLRAGTRLVVSQLDCIAFSNPQYAANATEWADYRALTQHTFALADGIIFISEDVSQDAEHQGLDIPAERKCVAYIGVDHELHAAAAQAPAASERLTAQPYILMIGTNFKHKNRPWALRAFAALIRKYEWPGLLVFAGPKVSYGGSETEEKLELDCHPELESRTCYLGPVSDSEKQWLLEHAALVLYPSNYEGFGLVPFEAAAAGTPALSMFSTSLREILGDQVIYLDSFNPEQGADTIWQLLSNPALAKRQLESIGARATLFTWDGTAKRVLAFYKQILQMPPRLREVPEALAEVRETNRLSEWGKLLRSGFRVLRTQGPIVLWSKARRRIGS